MGTARFTSELIEEAARLGVSTHSFCKWQQAFKFDNSEQYARDLLDAKSESQNYCATKTHRGITGYPEIGQVVIYKGMRLKYHFMNKHCAVYRV